MNKAVLFIIALFPMIVFAQLPPVCFPPPIFPSGPDVGAYSASFTAAWSNNDEFTVTVWRGHCAENPDDAILYLRITTYDGVPFICSESFQVYQDGLYYDVRLNDRYGQDVCEDVKFSTTYVLTTWSFDPPFDPNRYLSVIHHGIYVQSSVQLFDDPVTPPPPPVTKYALAIEYYWQAMDHYFITADPTEIKLLDSGKFVGWERTGYSFQVFTPDSTGSMSPVCRYIGNPAHGIDSHFYSAIPAECSSVLELFPDSWSLESLNVFKVYLPSQSTGFCQNSTAPIYRLFNQRSNANHRYTTDLNVRAQMIAQGWVPEGFGPLGVGMCSPI